MSSPFDSSPSDASPTDEDGTAQPTTREIPVVPPAAGTSRVPAERRPAGGRPPCRPTRARCRRHPSRPRSSRPSRPGPHRPPPVLSRPARWTSCRGRPRWAPRSPRLRFRSRRARPPRSSCSHRNAEGRTWPDTLDGRRAAEEVAACACPRTAAPSWAPGWPCWESCSWSSASRWTSAAARCWSLVPLWAAFATVAALLALVAFVPVPASRGASRQRRTASATTGITWRIAVGGLVGLAVFWLLVVLPHADTNRGFVLTAALGALGAGALGRAGALALSPEGVRERAACSSLPDSRCRRASSCPSASSCRPGCSTPRGSTPCRCRQPSSRAAPAVVGRGGRARSPARGGGRGGRTAPRRGSARSPRRRNPPWLLPDGACGAT